MQPSDVVIEHIQLMTDSHISNYILPGLISSLVGSGEGKVRLFTNTRHQHEYITPHSHRFDFQCLVLRGTVHNFTWTQTEDEQEDMYVLTDMFYQGQPGAYKRVSERLARMKWEMGRHEAGSWYGMKHDEIHSIGFSNDAVVLFFEGPPVAEGTVILEPYVNGQHLQTMATKPWMFQRT